MRSKREIIATLLAQGRPDLANVVARWGRGVAPFSDAIKEIKDHLRKGQVKVDRAKQRVESNLETLRSGVLEKRKFKLALTNLSKVFSESLTFKLKTKVRPGEKLILDSWQGRLDVQWKQGFAHDIKDLKNDLDKLDVNNPKKLDFYVKQVEMFALRGVDHVFKYIHEYIDERLAVKDFIPQSFEYEGFTVVDDYGFVSDEVRPTLDALSHAAKILRDRGFDYLLYGKVRLHDDSRSSYYSTDKDHVGLKTTHESHKRMVYVIIHELGHRLWFKFMDAGGRDKFASRWVDQDEIIRDTYESFQKVFEFPSGEHEEAFELVWETKFDFDSFKGWVSKDPARELRWLRWLVYSFPDPSMAYSEGLNFNEAAFDRARERIERYEEEKLRAQDQGDDLYYEAVLDRERNFKAKQYKEWVVNKYNRNRWGKQFSIEDIEGAYEALDSWNPNHKLHDLINKVLEIEPIRSVSDYGETNRKEDFAETFVNVILGKEKSLPVKMKLQEALPKGRVMSMTKAGLGKYLYHTTSLYALLSIMRSRKLEPKNIDNPFVSFSEDPYFGDIESNQVVIVFDANAMRSQVMKVKYNEWWYEKYPEHAAYIAGEGWREQYTQPEECFEYDEEEDWEEADEECLEEHYREAEFWAFEAKSDEKEWISKREHQPVKFKDEALRKILINVGGKRTEEAVREELVKLGLDHVEVEQL